VAAGQVRDGLKTPGNPARAHICWWQGRAGRWVRPRIRVSVRHYRCRTGHHAPCIWFGGSALAIRGDIPSCAGSFSLGLRPQPVLLDLAVWKRRLASTIFMTPYACPCLIVGPFPAASRAHADYLDEALNRIRVTSRMRRADRADACLPSRSAGAARLEEFPLALFDRPWSQVPANGFPAAAPR
jgi:hypothetical protein